VSASDFGSIAAALVDPGYSVIPGWLDADRSDALLHEAQASALRAAAIGRGGGRQQQAPVRGDRTAWIDEGTASSAVAHALQHLHELRKGLNAELFLGLDEYECQFAHYAPGTHYARHRDRFADDDARVISTVLYLNRDWDAVDGGALRLFLVDAGGESHVDLLPHTGQLVLFRSADIEHAVLPTHRDRYSIAGWMRRRARNLLPGL
jgi:SM-20-related protein